MADQNNMKETLKSKFVNFINDTATLDVITLTGKLQLKTTANNQDGNDKESFDWDAIFKTIIDDMKVDENSTISVVAYTHAEWDQDSVNYIAENADKELVEAHTKAVASAHESRMNALKSIADAIDKLISL